MAIAWSIWTAMVMCIVGVGAGIATKGFYCRDPDTGKMYPVNTTWPSTTFCGSYTCKLRKKNGTENALKNIFQLNSNSTEETENKINSLQNNQIVDIASRKNSDNIETKTSPIMATSQNDELLRLDIKTKPSVNNLIDKEETKEYSLQINDNSVPTKERVREMENNKNNMGTTQDGDRYLTDEEINALTELLHAMKKSDFEAIIEMYNLAQDVYEEIDTTTEKSNSNFVEETLNNLKTTKYKKGNAIKVNVGGKKNSYWYEPLAVPLNKPKLIEIVSIPDLAVELNEISNYVKTEKALDLRPEASQPSPLPKNAPPKGNCISNCFFKGPLTNDDFRKLPYYYPLTTFQRLNSYVHQRKKDVKEQNNLPNGLLDILLPQISTRSGLPQEIVPREIAPKASVSKSNVLQVKTPSKTLSSNSHIQFNKLLNDIRSHGISVPHQSHISYPSWYNRIVKKPFTVENEKKSLCKSKPVTLTPEIMDKGTLDTASFPVVYLQNLNFSDPNSNKLHYFFNINKINRNKNPQNNAQPFSYPAYVAHLRVGTELNNNIKVENPPANENEMPDWQTDPLPRSVLEEVKANIINKPRIFLPLSLRKKTKLERVGKVIKLDLERTKRNTEPKNLKGEMSEDEAYVNDLYEVYVSKNICDTDTEPGFFRMGNITEPFPACCPQRIGKNR